MKKFLIQADLVDVFGDARLKNIDKFTLQTHLNKLAKTRSKDRALQIRAYTKAIFAEAVDQEFLPKDPARTLKTPANLRETDKPVLTWEQLAAALARLDLRDRILLKLDTTNALRPSELFAFGGSAIGSLRSRSPLWRKSTRERSGPAERRKEV